MMSHEHSRLASSSEGQANIKAAISKVWHHIKNPSPSINAHLLEQQAVKFHPDPIWNDGVLGFFEEGHTDKMKKKNSNTTGSYNQNGH